MSEMIKDNKTEQNNNQEQLALDDGRRVKVLSPGMMVFKRFIRNRLAIVGICILVFMFVFSFLGGVISPQFVFFPEYDKGVYKKENTEMIVSSGCGSHKVHLRLFNKPEVMVVDIHGHLI